MAGPHDAVATLARELARSRRYDHPLTLIGIVPAHEDVAADVRRCLRTVDCTWMSHEEVFVLLPESDSTQGHALIDRMRSASPLLARAAMHLASFPADALTMEALLEAARGHTPPPTAEEPGASRRTTPALPRSTSAVPSP